MDLIDGLIPEDYLDQLIEECGELIQAACKLKRARNKRNYTPVTESEAVEKLTGEIADVLNGIEMVEQSENVNLIEVSKIRNSKYVRWKERMQRGEIP